MLVVTVTLISGIDGHVAELGRIEICNNGKGTKQCGNYYGRMFRKGSKTLISKSGKVEDYPRLSLSVWHLVFRMLKDMLTKEKS